jgi:hypothetical protein
MEATVRYRPAGNIVLREESDGAFLLDTDRGLLKYLNQSALEIYRMFDGRNDIETIVQRLEALYPDIQAESIRQDTLAYVDVLIREGLITGSSKRSLPE